MKKPLLTLSIVIFGILNLQATENHFAGARSLALSNAFISFSDVWSTFHNQAGISQIEKITAGIFYESRYMVDELSLTAGTIILPVNSGNFGISFYQFGEGSFKENKLGIAFAKKLSEKFHAGIQLDYYSNRFPENKKAFGYVNFEAGLIYTPDQKLFLGGHILNPLPSGIETPEGKQNSPAIFRFGAHYCFNELVLITTEAEKIHAIPFRLKTGIEFSPAKQLMIRFGVSGKPLSYTSGIGYTFKNVTTNIGFSYHANLGITPSISLQFSL